MSDNIQVISFFCLMMTGLISLIPFRLSKGWRSASLCLPIIGYAFYVVYDMSIPAKMNIRLDLAFIMPMLLFLWLNGIAKIGIMLAIKAKAGGIPAIMDCYPQRILQVAFTLPILLICGFRFYRMW